MRGISNWLFAVAATGLLGAFLPWFEPSYPGAGGNTWYSWDDKVGLLPLVVAFVAGALGFVLAQKPGGSPLPRIEEAAKQADKMIWLPLLSLGACIWVFARLPSEDVLQTCYGQFCAGADSSWIDAPGASRGTQFGFVLSVLSTVMAVGVGVALYVQRELVADHLVGTDSPAPQAVPEDGPAQVLPRSNQLPKGERSCRRLNCAWRGVPVVDERCEHCEHQTVLLSEHDLTLMAAPGVVYDASYVAPTAVDHDTNIGDVAVGPPAPLDVDGRRVCRRLNCVNRGVLTDVERCTACGHQTVVPREYRDVLFASPGVPLQS